MCFVRYEAGLTKQIIPSVGKSAFLFYLGWNGVWIVKGEIPPSILTALAGVPCPTTGGVRSFVAFCRGEYLQSFYLNPLMVVYLLLAVYSLAILLRQAFRGHRLVINTICAWTWGLSLMIGWIAKFALGKQYW